jgi:hypothetical protein
MDKDSIDISFFDDLFDLEELNKLYCQNSECGKSYTLVNEADEADENGNHSYCSKKCMNHDMIKDHKCENPSCKNTYKLQNRIKGNYKNRKYCSEVCFNMESEVEKKEQKLEEQWFRIPYNIKSRLQIDNLIEVYRWRELLEYRILLDFDNSDPTNKLALDLILSLDS